MDPDTNPNGPGDEMSPPRLEPLKAGAQIILLAENQLWKFGRGSANHVVLDDARISRYHAMIQHAGPGEYVLIDVGSRNGCFVNGSRVTVPARLRDGDRVAFAEQEFLFHCPAEEEELANPDTATENPDSTRVLYSLQTITVLVIDICDFTGLAKKLGESAIASAVGAWVGRSGEILASRGSRFQKYIGDAIMAIWVHEDQAGNSEVLLRVLDALDGIAQVTAGLEGKMGLSEPVRIGAGLSTGAASLGNLGSSAAADFTALGDTVNRAFRLESASRGVESEVLLEPETFRLIAELGAAGEGCRKHEVELKGYEGKHACYGLTFAELSALLAPMRRED